MCSPVVRTTAAPSAPDAARRASRHRPTRETDPGEQLAHDLLALVRRGLVDVHRDSTGGWRAALAGTIDR